MEGIYGGTVKSLAVSGNNIFAGDGVSGVWLSTNNGNTWTQTALRIGNILSLAVSGNNIFAGTNDGYGVYLSTNNGTSWTQTALNNNMVYTIIVSGSNIFAGTDNGVYLTTNNGTSWIQKNQGFNVTPLVGALLIANNYIFAENSGYSLWRRSLTEIIGIQNISTEIPSAYSLGQNYPNPFNPSTTIKFSIPNGFPIKTFGNDNVVLKVFDVSGREVETLVNEQLQPGTYQADWNASNYSSGVYFYKITVRRGGSSTNDYSETKRMLLVK